MAFCNPDFFFCLVFKSVPMQCQKSSPVTITVRPVIATFIVPY